MACLSGEVVKAHDSIGGYGKHILVNHPDGWSTWYCHLDKILVGPGDQIEKGMVIGLAGNSGNSTGPHLHLTVQHEDLGMDGYWLPNVVDPLLYL